jgi:hypothetical protein
VDGRWKLLAAKVTLPAQFVWLPVIEVVASRLGRARRPSG